MSFGVAYLIRPIYSSELLDYGVPYSSILRVVPILLRNPPISLYFCSCAVSDMIASSVPTSFANFFTAYSTSPFVFMGTTYTKHLSVTKILHQVWPLEDSPDFFVENKVSTKKYYFICLYRHILSFVL